MRALATLSIVVYHSWLAGHNIFGLQGPTVLSMLGALGVACFFSLSAFLLARPYIAALLAGRALPSWRGFARDRFLRIYPLYAVLAIVFTVFTSAFVIPGEHPATALDAIAHLTFLFPLWRVTALAVDPPMWTMATDVQFYVVMPLIFALVAWLVARTRVAPAALVAAVIALGVALGLVFRIAHTGEAMTAFQDFGLKFMIFGQLPGMFTAFGCGILAALAWALWEERFRFQLAAVALALALPLLWMAANAIPPGIVPYILWNDVLAGAGAASLLLAGCLLLRSRVVENPVVRWAERLSYAIYLIHFFVIERIEGWTARFPGWSFVVATAIVAYLVSAAIALPLYLLVERPFLQLKARLRRARA